MAKQFHAVSGLPRSGSTLLCNLLNQNPAFHASSTSPMAATFEGIHRFWSGSSEVRSDLARDKEATQERLRRTSQAMLEGWYADHEEPVIFDKGRGWATIADAMVSVIPRFKIILCVRDPRDVFASIESKHQEFPIFTPEPAHPSTLYQRANQMFSPQGLIGGPMTQAEDLARRQHPAVIPVLFEKLTEDPESTLKRVYAHLEIEYYPEHDFENVEDSATDLDALYLNKYPHHHETGHVQKPSTNWMHSVPMDIASAILERYPTFCKTFGYNPPTMIGGLPVHPAPEPAQPPPTTT